MCGRSTGIRQTYFLLIVKACLKAAIWEVPAGLEDALEVTSSFSAPFLEVFWGKVYNLLLSPNSTSGCESKKIQGWTIYFSCVVHGACSVSFSRRVQSCSYSKTSSKTFLQDVSSLAFGLDTKFIKPFLLWALFSPLSSNVPFYNCMARVNCSPLAFLTHGSKIPRIFCSHLWKMGQNNRREKW